ncbi:helix-turn-helix domain-containing protein [Acholeplasma vituli]|uniref:Helix-turn-helix domain-containing protein n=1 Tax=Paracholeplasma vituli TaxID=69473 RepID=A0ABT2PWD1_9MOLU|nr:helix-turn-helix transcriptional regulator [Paracholeplasma vituli]MCU0104731.1 helix-turn-helix domain-containing protein [Paracholeplasma vituli]
MNRLKEIRIGKGITQAELARALKVSQQAISSYESGTRAMDYNFIIRASLYLEVTPNDLLDFKEEYKNYTEYLISLKNEKSIS